jgi:hypothetical protein
LSIHASIGAINERKRAQRVSSILLLIVVLSACSSQQQTTADTSLGTVPQGVLVTSAQDSASQGLWVSPAPDDPACCWVSPNVELLVEKKIPAVEADLSVVVPGFAFFADGGQTVSVSIDGRTTAFPKLAVGSHVLSVKLSSRRRAFLGHMPIDVRSARTFVPARTGVNGDTRKLGFVLQGVSFK